MISSRWASPASIGFPPPFCQVRGSCINNFETGDQLEDPVPAVFTKVTNTNGTTYHLQDEGRLCQHAGYWRRDWVARPASSAMTVLPTLTWPVQTAKLL